MPKIYIGVVSHLLTINPYANAVAQRKYKVYGKKKVVVDKEVRKLYGDGFIMKEKNLPR